MIGIATLFYNEGFSWGWKLTKAGITIILKITLLCICFQVENILKPLDLNDEDYVKVMDAMTSDIIKGLTPMDHEASNIKCFPTYVRSVPDGTGLSKHLDLINILSKLVHFLHIFSSPMLALNCSFKGKKYIYLFVFSIIAAPIYR